MNPLAPIAIVPQSAITRGNNYRRLWLAGWGFGTIALASTAFVSGKFVAYRDAMRELEHDRAEIRQIRADQQHTTEAFVAAWQDQREDINLVVSWATFIKDREDILAQNKKSEPINISHFAFKAK